ncbi:MAG: NAD(P)-dependent alcohol dehydrogenase [Actinomycetia bacterium]|nr:NAD(P)-dependent alcohol dehydrogenase [Actinomycetes bacterium]
MKAIVQRAYGSDEVLRLEDVPVPSVGAGEVLVRVHAASLHADIWHVVTGRPYVMRLMGGGLRRPKVLIPGIDLAGRVESVGPGVTQFKPGDDVFGECVRGIQWKNGGAFAEYASVLAKDLAPMPEKLSYIEAAAIPTSGLIALQAVRDEGDVQSRQRILINGAGGAVGTFAVQLAKAYAGEVTGVDSAEKLDALCSLGADHVIDYALTDFTTTGDRYDLIIDIPGTQSLSSIRDALTPEGTYVFVGHDQYGRRGHPVIGSIGRILHMLVMTPFVPQFKAPGKISPRDERLAILTELVGAGHVTPFIDSTYPLAEIRQALRRLEQGTAIGKIVVTISE